MDKKKEKTISLKEIKRKVQKAINNISTNQGLDLDTAFEKVRKS